MTTDKMTKKWVIKDSGFYWEDCGDFKRSADLNNCTKFRFWIIAYLTFLDQIAYGAKIVRFDKEIKEK
jgi:hypothetical protein